MPGAHPIGVFDSGYGGLTVLQSITDIMPEYDFLYLGDNARAPYGNRSFETVYEYTLECVQWFFDQGCPLVVLACNTASAKALRTIQQNDLPVSYPDKRVLGVIRPTAEIIGNYSTSGRVGVLATNGTVQSQSYPIEIAKFFPSLQVFQQACPLWVPLIENNEHLGAGADYFIKEYVDALLAKSAGIDTVLLACTHYPLLMDKLRAFIPPAVRIVAQGEIVATSLQDYLTRHPEIDSSCSKTGGLRFYTTDDVGDFDRRAGIFYKGPVKAERVW